MQTLDDPHCELVGHSVCLCHGRWTDCHIAAASSHSPLLRLSVVQPFVTVKGQMASKVKTEENQAVAISVEFGGSTGRSNCGDSGRHGVDKGLGASSMDCDDVIH